ncbi:hypothetical protein KSI01_25830 [Kurthia sibirica]|nr:hypothetical protein KSI01_25830 [Kurthia sibirica]
MNWLYRMFIYNGRIEYLTTIKGEFNDFTKKYTSFLAGFFDENDSCGVR